MESRVCRKCGVVKPFSEYNRDPKGKFGLAASCRECKNGLRRKIRLVFSENNLKKIKEIARNYIEPLSRLEIPVQTPEKAMS